MIALIQKIGKEIACFLIRCYQSTRFLRRPSCRFYPSCSEYTHKSIQQHGLFKGVFAGVMRIARCHPWNPGGVDEVPETISLNETFKIKRSER